MPLDALPERLQDPANWAGTDMDNKYQKWILKYIHGWFAYGVRSKHWWAKWSSPPKNVFKIGGKGDWRYEIDPLSLDAYLSRIQYYKQWHVQVQWPFMIAAHFYWGTKPFYFYIGAHYDQDSVYWFPSAFIGGTWK